MRIDTHAHAFPGLSYWSRDWPRPVRVAAQAGAGALARLGGRRARRNPRLTVERLARFRRRGPRRVHDALEMSAGVALLPDLIARAGIDDLLASMDRHRITRTVVIGSHPSAPNDWLLEQAALHDDRIIAVAHPPHLPGASETDLIDAYDTLAQGGAAGFKIHPNMDGLPAGATTYRAMFEVARERGCFIIVHTGCFHVVGYKTREPSSPELFESYFRDYPEVRVCLAHMNRDQPEAAWEIMARHDQLFADTSWQTAGVVRRAVDRVGASRVVLGSDWPLLHAELQGDCLAVVERACTDAEVSTIVDTAARMLVGDSP